jgi:hypothetical protein
VPEASGSISWMGKDYAASQAVDSAGRPAQTDSLRGDARCPR